MAANLKMASLSEAAHSSLSLPASNRSRRSMIFRRRSQAPTQVPKTTKPVVLTLKLTSLSFLDANIKDPSTKQPVYTINTAGTSSTISRLTPWAGVHRVADIKWPKLVPIKTKPTDPNGVLVQMRGKSWMSSEEILRPSSSGLSYKFNIPGYSRRLKWKKKGQCYVCTTEAVTGPIAILHLAEDSTPAYFDFFESLRDKHDTRPLAAHSGVSTVLLDSLVITATMLVTDIQEWMVVKKYDGVPSNSNPTHNQPSDSASDHGTAASDEQWRKIAFREPMFPKKRAPSAISEYSSSEDPHTPSTFEDLAGLGGHGVPSRPPSPSPSSIDSFIAPPLSPDDEPVEEEDTIRRPRPLPTLSLPSEYPSANEFHYRVRRAPSPSAESVFYPISPSSAPSHTYIDPTFYNASQESNSSLQIHLSPNLVASAPNSASSGRLFPRELPMTPSPMSSQSTPSESTVSSPSTIQCEQGAESPVSPTSHRRLPQPPGRGSPLNRQPSSSRISIKKRQSVYGRSLPPAPGSTSEPNSIDSHKLDYSRFTLFPRQSVFDLPPPAYNSIDFQPAPGATTIPPNTLPTIPPVPPLPSFAHLPGSSLHVHTSNLPPKE